MLLMVMMIMMSWWQWKVAQCPSQRVMHASWFCVHAVNRRLIFRQLQDTLCFSETSKIIQRFFDDWRRPTVGLRRTKSMKLFETRSYMLSGFYLFDIGSRFKNYCDTSRTHCSVFIFDCRLSKLEKTAHDVGSIFFWSAQTAMIRFLSYLF